MKCKVECCDFIGQDLTVHIIRKHGMLIVDYLKQYGGEIIDEELKKQRIESRKNKYSFKCPVNSCFESFETQKGLENHINECKTIEHNHYKFNESNKDEWVECTACTWRDHSITKHLREHNIQICDYKGELNSKLYAENQLIINKKIREKFAYICQVKSCNEHFKTQNSLNRHLINSEDIEHNHCLFNEENKDEWVACMVCDIRKNVLTRHLMDKHDMTIEYYRKNYNGEVYSKNYKSKYQNFINAGAHAEKERRKIFSCKNCDNAFSTDSLLQEHIAQIHCHLIYNETNKDEWVECQVVENDKKCDFRSIKISSHIKSKHEMTTEEYKKRYNSPVVSINHIERINKNWGDLSENAEKRKQHMHKCAIDKCNNIIVGEQMICVECKLKSKKLIQEQKFKDKIENVDFVRCKCKLENGEVCGWPDTRISKHIEHHGFNVQSYREMFGEDSSLICLSTTQKTAPKNRICLEETRQKMSESHKYSIPWNKGLTKQDHPSVKSIADKATIRMGQLQNNNWSMNPLSGDRNGMKGHRPWSKSLTKETSELIEKRDETNSGIFQHKSFYNNQNDVYSLNKFIEQFKETQKSKVRLKDEKCILCNSKENINVHHIHPESLFDKYDISAHYFQNLVTLCSKCHSREGQQVDKAILSSDSIEKMFKEFPLEYEIYNKFISHVDNRFISYFPISKNFVEKLDVTQRSALALQMFNELRIVGFPYSKYSDDDLLKDLQNIEQCSCYFSNSILQNHNFSGSRFREHFVHEQYREFLEIFKNDDVLLKVIRNRLGLDWKNKPEFFNMNYKIIIKGFEVLFPKKRFSKYKATTAKWVIETFCEGKNVFDYSAGWGDRMLGAIASGRNYIGVDTNEKLVEELNQSAQWLKKNRKNEIQIIHGNSANYDKTIEFAYSCPPYGNQEEYEGSIYLNDKDWLERFMIPVINMCAKNLVNNGKFVCHLPVRLSGIVINELNKKFNQVQIVKIFNTHDAYHGGKERQNELILVYQKKENI
jgi:predicted transcriptional regulator